MNPLVRAPYSLAGGLARIASALAPAGEGKLAASLRARRGIRGRYAAWSAAHRDPLRPLLWIHAASVGEGLQALAVIQRLRARHPDWQLAYTYFSPSARAFALTIGADFTDYLPFDTAGDADAALDALRPTALVFSKLDVWPLFVAGAVARGIPVGLISATLSGTSARRSPLTALILGGAYRSLARVGAIATDDATRLEALGVAADHVSVTGDSRYDQVWARAQSVDLAAPLLAPFTGAAHRPTLVAGSTWPADEAPLLKAWRTIGSRAKSPRLIIAPHEPTATHLEPIERWARRESLLLVRLGAPGAAAANVVLVDRVGVLGDLYALADVAFVGGGFHAAGLHSVLEPAAFGAPVIFGPRHHASRDALLLLEQGGAFTASTAAELSACLASLLGEGAARERRIRAGTRARALVEAGLGAADRGADLVESLMTPAAVPSARG